MEGSDCLYVYFCPVHLEVIDVLLNGFIYINLVNRNITLTVQLCQLPGLRLLWLAIILEDILCLLS
jgi:hypothetical protein